MSTKIPSEVLSKFKPLDTLNPENIRDISSKIEIVEHKKGSTLFNKGDSDDNHIYLFQGKVEFVIDGKVEKKFKAGSEEAMSPLGHVLPRSFTVIAKSDVIVFKVNSDLLDMMMTWDQTGNFQVEELSSEEDDDDDWMTRILQTEAFMRIPPANIQAIFTSLEDINVKLGDAIIKQDDPGDYFYIIKSGRCMVSRKLPGQETDIKLADLNEGDTFGEEALISDAKRNATIVMLSDGVLSRLSKEDFLKLLNEPMLDKLTFSNAKEKVINDESEWLDVRMPDEYKSAHIKGATLIPLIALRMKFKTLDTNKSYILYCDTGRRSSSASYIMNERGFNTSVLENGTKNVPQEEMEGTNIPT